MALCARRGDRDRLEISAPPSTASTSSTRPALRSSCCCSPRPVSGYRRASGARVSGLPLCSRSSRSLCCRRRAVPTLQSSFSEATPARAWWLGGPAAIPPHQLQSGALLIFTFFMISDPRTSPDSRLGRFLFALAVALLAHWLAFFLQMRPALYVALIVLAPSVFLLDAVLPGRRFAWASPANEGAS